MKGLNSLLFLFIFIFSLSKVNSLNVPVPIVFSGESLSYEGVPSYLYIVHDKQKNFQEFKTLKIISNFDINPILIDYYSTDYSSEISSDSISSLFYHSYSFSYEKRHNTNYTLSLFDVINHFDRYTILRISGIYRFDGKINIKVEANNDKMSLGLFILPIILGVFCCCGVPIIICWCLCRKRHITGGTIEVANQNYYAQPTVQPIVQPTVQPVYQPGVQPVYQPGAQPVYQPGAQPVYQPGVQPVYQQPVQPAATYQQF